MYDISCCSCCQSVSQMSTSKCINTTHASDKSKRIQTTSSRQLIILLIERILAQFSYIVFNKESQTLIKSDVLSSILYLTFRQGRFHLKNWITSCIFSSTRRGIIVFFFFKLNNRFFGYLPSKSVETTFMNDADRQIASLVNPAEC